MFDALSKVRQSKTVKDPQEHRGIAESDSCDSTDAVFQKQGDVLNGREVR
jgi:hypothetical protein